MTCSFRLFVSSCLGLVAFAQAPRASRPHPVMVAGDAVRPPEEGVVQLKSSPMGVAPDEARPGQLPVGSSEAATRQNYLLEEAAKTFAGANQKPMSATGIALSPVIDAQTGLVKEDAEALEAAIHNDNTLIDRDIAGPLGPGRRERLAEIAGISPEEAAKLWPYKDPEPFRAKDLTEGARELVRQMSQRDAEGNLVPGQRQDREDIIKNATLTDAEASFAVHAALGLPFPIRVGKVDTAGINGDGFVLFSPELLRADVGREDWEERLVTYRWMNNEEEVYRDTVRVRPFMNILRPNAATTHMWVTCDKDVMVYAPRGVAVPSTIAEARDQVQRDVVPANSWLRTATKIYGIRWGLLPTVTELTKNPATREKLRVVMLETGLLNRGPEPNQLADEFRRMADLTRSVPMATAPPVKR